MAPYEALYGRKCSLPFYWDEVGERQNVRPEIMQRICDKISIIKEYLKVAQAGQKSYVDEAARLEISSGRQCIP